MKKPAPRVAVQVPPRDYEILATIELPSGHDHQLE
jgi:hypothetical protein